MTWQLKARKRSTQERKSKSASTTTTKKKKTKTTKALVIKTVYDKKWLEKYEELKVFQQEHGNCNVPKRQGQLGNWVQWQRQTFRMGQMRADRQDLLDEIGFVWGDSGNKLTNNRKWMQQYKNLKAYKEENGHCSVPRSEGSLGFGL